jgi:ribonuclease BN (tRNA processing enzyme)
VVLPLAISSYRKVARRSYLTAELVSLRHQDSTALPSLSAVLISHLHIDHWLDLAPARAEIRPSEGSLRPPSSLGPGRPG